MTVNTVLICGWLSSVISPPICIGSLQAPAYSVHRRIFALILASTSVTEKGFVM